LLGEVSDKFHVHSVELLMNLMHQSSSFASYYLVNLRDLVVFDPLVHLVFHFDISGLSAWLLLYKLVVVA